MKTDTREKFRKYCDPEQFDRIREMESVSEMWDYCVREYSTLPAIQDSGKVYTYAEIDSDVRHFRPLLTGDDDRALRVGIFAPNSYEFVKAYLSVVTLGYAAVILPSALDEKSLYGCMMKYSVDVLVYHPDLKDKTVFAQNALADKTFIDVSSLSEIETGIRYPKGDDPCVIMFTGGTTGKSKGAVLSNTAVMQGTVNGCYGVWDVFHQRYLLVLPLFHVFGLIRNLMTSLYTGSFLYICKNNKDMFRDIAAFNPTVLVLVPALAEMALNLSKKFNRNMLGSSLKYIICGAAAVPPYLIKEYKTQFDITLLQGYGLTESANLVSGNPESLEKPESVGIMYPNQEYLVRDGELLLKGKNMMSGYIGESEEDIYTSDGWFRTGDLVRFDDEGFLYITGRIKEIIVLPSGENISPAELEVRFLESVLIQDAQVYEDLGADGSHILALEVVPRLTETAKLDVEDVKSAVISQMEEINNELPVYQRVSKIIVRDSDFDRTPSMKIRRYKSIEQRGNI